ncbi:alcohol dehydrogenase [Xylariaceae sp. FL0255]|nr:alcohol dehydrogenase [Xylariaceae sp. FL0255]
MATSSLPSTMRAVVQTGPGQATLETVPLPKVEPGIALVKLEVSLVHANIAHIFKGDNPMFTFPWPTIPGSFGIGRIAAVGPDATTLKEGQLVLCSAFARARDNPAVSVITGVTAGFSPQAEHLYKTVARSGFWAEYTPALLENVHVLDETRLFGQLGYEPADLLVLAADAIAYGGLRRINIQPGERIIVTPATGHYSSATVDVAVALGARVVAASRNAESLAKLKAQHAHASGSDGSTAAVETVQLTGDIEADAKALGAFGPVDAVIDISPPAATGAPNLATAISVLRENGRICLLGARGDKELPVPYIKAMLNNWTISGSYMYARADFARIVRLAETGLLRLGKRGGHEIVGAYGLDDFKAAIDRAVETSAPGTHVYLKN